MELTIERDAFIKSLSKVQGIVEKRNAMPILSNTLLKAEEEGLQVIATDLEVTVMDKCPVSLQSGGNLTLNAKKLFDVVREMDPGPVSLTSDDDYKVVVKAGKMRYELMGMPSEDYPKVPDTADLDFVNVPAETLLEMILKTIYASGGEEARFSIHGIYAEKGEDNDKVLRMVATDGHRMAMIDRELDSMEKVKIENGVILPRKGMSEAAKLLADIEGEVGFAVQEKMAAVSVEDTVLVMRLVDGKFPDYRKVIVEGCDKTATIDKGKLVKNLRSASHLVDEKARAVKFAFSENTLALESKNQNFGSFNSEMEIEYDGTPVTIGFNDRYFLDIANTSKGDKLKVELKDEQSPAMVKLAEDDNYTCVVMPMRL